MSSTRSGPRTLLHRGTALLTAGILALGTAACGDDEESAEDRYCAAGDALEASIEALASVDVVSGGLDAVQEQFDAVRDDLGELRDAGAEVAADELDALDASVDALGESISALGDDLSAENATAIRTAIGDVGTAATAVFDALADTCS